MADLWRYTRERTLRPLFVVVACAIVAAALLDQGVALRWMHGVDVVAVWGLVWQLRLWDDLIDLPVDRVRHPDRALVCVVDRRPFWLALWIVGGLVCLWLLAARSTADGLVYVSLLGGLALWYGGLRTRLVWPVLHYHVVLLKYPVLVCLAAPVAGVPWRAMVGAYLAVCVYEALHDRRVGRLPAARVAAGVEVVALLVGAVLLGRG